MLIVTIYIHDCRKIVGTNLSRNEIIKDYRKTSYQGFSNGTWSSLRNQTTEEKQNKKQTKVFKGSNIIRIQNSKKIYLCYNTITSTHPLLHLGLKSSNLLVKETDSAWRTLLFSGLWTKLFGSFRKKNKKKLWDIPLLVFSIQVPVGRSLVFCSDHKLQ